MARTLYAGRPGDFVVGEPYAVGTRLFLTLPLDANGDPTSVQLEVWDAPDGQRLTDLTDFHGNPITAVTVPAGTGQIPPFYGPNGYADDVWLRDPDGDFARTGLGPQGPPGDDGNSIASITRTAGDGSPGSTDTYTVTLTDSSTTTFQVYNGADGQGTGDINGPTSSTGGHFAAFTDATGKTLADTGYAPTDFATAEQGAMADSAVQPTDLAAVAFSGSYDDLVNTPSGGGGSRLLDSASLNSSPNVSNIVTTSTTPVELNAALQVDVTFPASGQVMVTMSGLAKIGSSSAASIWSLRIGTTDVAQSDRAVAYANTNTRAYYECIVTGAPGTAATIKWAQRSSNSSYESTVMYGGITGPLVMNAWEVSV